MAARDGMTMLCGNAGSAHRPGSVCSREVYVAQARAASTARFGFGCPAAVVVSTYCPMQRMTSNRQEAPRSNPSDVVLGEPLGTAGESASFWNRLHEAWRVLLGTPSEAQVTKQRFRKLLVRDRGFNPANLSRLYTAAEGAIAQHVELENDGDAVVTAAVDRLGELRLDFRVRRVKSVLMDESFSDSHPFDIETTLGMPGHCLWEDTWEDTANIQDLEVQTGSSSKLNSDAHPDSETHPLSGRDVDQRITVKVGGELDKKL